jgi:signal-transduction protein with cAMP-binding, CBS, and nucleotidyltransferase domain
MTLKKPEPIVESIMSKQLITIDADSSAFQAAKKMSEKVVSSIIIKDSGKIVGILTERDFIKQVCAADLQASKTPVTSIMSSPLIVIDKGLGLEKAAGTMIKNKVRHLAVSYSNNQIIGIISSRDLIRLFIDKLESIGNTTPQLLKALYWEEEPMEGLGF